jgi:branched-chain amino acid aminotransferase
LERLFRSARAILLEVGLTLPETQEAVLQTLRANKLKDAYIRLVVTRGVGDLGLDPKKCPRATVFVIADKITLYPEECYTHGLEVNTVSTRRTPSQALSPNIKSLNYLNNIMAKIEAGLSGAREAIMLSTEGYVAECTGDNIFYFKDGRLVTPPVGGGRLGGDHTGGRDGIGRRGGHRRRGDAFSRRSTCTPPTRSFSRGRPPRWCPWSKSTPAPSATAAPANAPAGSSRRSAS